MKLGRNLAAGIASSMIIAIVGLAVVPLYIKYLGIEAFGLIGFFGTLQALFLLLDFGLAQTLNREVSKCSVTGDWKRARNLLRTLALIYWAMALCIAAIVFSFSHPVATRWIQAEQLSASTVRSAVQLMGVAIACRWPIGLYQGALYGMQLNTVTSAVAVGMTFFTVGGAILLLAFVSPTVETFFAWQACAGLIYALTLRAFAWRAVGSSAGSRFDVDELRRIWKFATSVAAISLSAIILTQLDKLILSKMLSLEDFAHYMLATTIAGSLYLLVAPLFNVIYARFSLLAAQDNEAELRLTYRVGIRLFSILLFPLAFLMAAFAEPLLRIWTGNSSLAADVAPMLSILAVGTALHGVTYFPYSLQLACGLPQLALRINLLLLLVHIPLTVGLASRHGAIGGAFAWLVVHSAYVVLGTWITHKRVLREVGARLLFGDVAKPLLISVFTFGMMRYVENWMKSSIVLSLVLAAVSVLIAVAGGLAISPQARSVVVAWLRVRHMPR